MNLKQAPLRLGFVAARRDFFSAALAVKMRDATVKVMEAMGLEVVTPTHEQTKHGCVGDLAEAEICGDLFRRHDVQGIVINAVNFGDEQAVARVLQEARLDVPVLIVGCQEEEVLTMKTDRRDSFCGLLSIGDALRQIGVKYSVGQRPICFPTDEAFKRDMVWFAGVCRVMHGLRRARYMQIGVRPDPFWTCRYDERALQRLGPTVSVMNLMDMLAEIAKIKDADPDVARTMKEITGSVDTSSLADLALLKIAKLEVFLDRYRQQHGIDAYAIQCWTAMQHHYGICTCTSMGRMNDRGVPCACEADIMGLMSMHACQLASQSAAALADWNNLHNEDDELVNLWHCGVLPPSFAGGDMKIETHGILATSGATRPEDSQGVCEFVAAAGPVTVFRITEDAGEWKAMVAQGAFEDSTAQTFGAYGWCRIPQFQRLYRDVLLNYFPHHAAMTQTHVGNILWEVFGKYLGFKMYHADQATPGLYTSRLPFADVKASRPTALVR